MSSFQVLKIDSEVKRRLLQKLALLGEVIGFEEDPALASLCACLGLEFELGKKDYDRLSPFFGVDISELVVNPWLVEIIAKEDKIGLSLTRKDGGRLQIRHPDFQYILAPESFTSDGTLSRIILFPSDIARNFKNRGFELVIVREWVRTSCLNPDPSTQVQYLYANRWEIEANVALVQGKMMEKRQLAFSGTHDIVDHLLGSDFRRFDLFSSVFREAKRVLTEVFPIGSTPSRSELLLSYLVGVLLDDMAQPKWYGSKEHEILLLMALKTLEKRKVEVLNSTQLSLPSSFHTLVANLREGTNNLLQLSRDFSTFTREIEFGARPPANNTRESHPKYLSGNA